jgi:cation transport protein ChaC
MTCAWRFSNLAAARPAPEAELQSDPYRHLPQLRDKILPAEQSQVRATPERLAFWDAQARAMGLGAGWRLSDEVLFSSRQAMLARWPAGEPIWIFGYGSLLWDPGFHFDEVRSAEVIGFQRRFSLRVEIGRGTPERPALMLGLEPGGYCRGLAFRIAADRIEPETAAVWCREMLQGHYRPECRAAATPQGEIPVLVFGTNTEHAQYVGERPLAEAAAVIANGHGLIGSNRQYLETLVSGLDALGIEETYLKALLDEVCRRGGA